MEYIQLNEIISIYNLKDALIKNEMHITASVEGTGICPSFTVLTKYYIA
jgi:hypothetical protein